ncbi:MAG: DNA cytosine methyltransferase [Rhizobiaceae bacterium]
MHSKLRSLELCAGAGGQALGLERAGFEHIGLFENDKNACETLRLNRPNWPVFELDLFQNFDVAAFRGVDLLAGGLPCPPFSVAGKQLGEGDERNLFTRGVDLAEKIQPNAIMFENVRGMLSPSFAPYRDKIELRLKKQGYWVDWRLLQSSDFGVPQLRPRVVMIAIKRQFAAGFDWPTSSTAPKSVGDCLYDLMAENGWCGALEWKQNANRIAPTLVGGSKKHGGPDLGPTRARKAWLELGVDGSSVTNDSPSAQQVGLPKLTVRMAARLQGFPDSWQIYGKKTAAYRQVGNAFPPPVAEAVGRQVALALGLNANLKVA